MTTTAFERLPATPLTDEEVTELADLLFELPEDFTPLDIVAVDGYLTTLALSPEPVEDDQWLWHVVGEPEVVPGDPIPTIPGRLGYLLERRRAELANYIEAREPFDPIVMEIEDDAGESLGGHAGIAALEPWAEGFLLGLTENAALADRIDDDEDAMSEVMRILRHLPDDLLVDEDEGRQDLAAAKAELADLEPLADLEEAIGALNDAVLALADRTRPRLPLVRAEPKVGRNDPCPCGSGRKYKRCHGGGGEDA